MKSSPLFLSLGFLFGVSIISLFGQIDISAPLLMLLGLLMLPVFFMLKPKKLLLFSLLILGIVLAQLRFNEYVKTPASTLLSYENQMVTLEGTIATPPDTGFKKQSFHVESESVNGKRINGSLIRISTQSKQRFFYGERISVKGQLARPEAFETDADRVFRYDRFLEKDNIFFVIQRAEVSLIDSAPISISGYLAGVKNTFLNALYKNIKRPHSGLAAGMLLGEKSALGDHETDSFRKSGLMHVVVLSGYNVSLVIYILLMFMKPMPRVARLVLVLLGIAGFGVLAGGGATVFRACLMGGLIAVSQIFGEHYNVKRALYVAVLVMVWANPMTLLFDISFQLSVLATYGLLELAPLIESRFHRLPVFLRSTLGATIAAQIMVSPIILWAIGDISIVAIVVNVLVLFMVPIAMLMSFVVGVLSLLLGSAGIVSLLAEFSLGYVLRFSDIFANLSFAHATVSPFHWFWMLLSYAGILFFIYRYKHRLEKNLDRLR